MTKEEELTVIYRFKEIYKDFPEGFLHHSDMPDFILKTLTKKIGIELTQIVHSEKDKQLNQEELNFTDLVISKLVPLLPYHFSLSIHLIPEIGVSKSTREILSHEVALFCAKEFLLLNDMNHAHVEHLEFDFDNALEEYKNHLLQQGFRNLSKGIKSISIFRCDIHGESFNSQSGAAVIPNFTFEKLTEVLYNKENKISKYQYCDEYWLLIWQGSGITGYFNKIDFETPIQSSFDKVFTLRSFKNDIIILKP